MANEAVLRERHDNPTDFIVADGTGIEKGALLALTDPRTAVAATEGAVLAGIAAREKVASDGRTRLAVYRNGIFDMKASGAILIGQDVSASEDNHVKAALIGASGAVILGTALEAASDAETIQVEVKLN